jgi:hypothetical protein
MCGGAEPPFSSIAVLAQPLANSASFDGRYDRIDYGVISVASAVIP